MLFYECSYTKVQFKICTLTIEKQLIRNHFNIIIYYVGNLNWSLVVCLLCKPLQSNCWYSFLCCVTQTQQTQHLSLCGKPAHSGERVKLASI